jgi:hypothetical protein
MHFILYYIIHFTYKNKHSDEQQNLLVSLYIIKQKIGFGIKKTQE